MIKNSTTYEEKQNSTVHPLSIYTPPNIHTCQKRPMYIKKEESMCGKKNLKMNHELAVLALGLVAGEEQYICVRNNVCL